MLRLSALAALALMLAAPAMAEESCVNSGPVMAKAAMVKSLHDRGYTEIRSLSSHNGCYEAKGIDSKGRRFELELNGSDGKIATAQ